MLYRIAIVGYRVPFIPAWDPDDIKKGLPGSEECVVYASQELSKRGHSVTIYMAPPENSAYKTGNPLWLPVELWSDSNHPDKYDIVLLWRHTNVDLARQRGKYVIFWPHDSLPILKPGTQFASLPKLDGAFPLSEHHRRQLSVIPRFNQIPYSITGNGYLPEQFTTPCRATNPVSLGYFSNYARGLIILMMFWPLIRAEFPNATLSICYGRETWGTLPKEQFDNLINKIESYRDHGVIEHGKIGHQALADIMETTSIWAYPCVCTGETFCITAVKAQAAGCIPVTTRIGALDETVHPQAPCSHNIVNMTDANDYIQVLLATMRRVTNENPEVILAERHKYVDFAQKFVWPRTIDKWEEFFVTLK